MSIQQIELITTIIEPIKEQVVPGGSNVSLCRNSFVKFVLWVFWISTTTFAMDNIRPNFGGIQTTKKTRKTKTSFDNQKRKRTRNTC